MVPSLGRIVHYKPNYQHASLAAIITAVHLDPAQQIIGAVDLVVFDGNKTVFYTCIPSAARPTDGHWNWPPRVEPA